MPGVSTSIYIAMIVIMLAAIGTSWLVLPAQKAVRGDGTLVEIEASVRPMVEFREFLKMLGDWRMLALFLMCFASNYFYAYQSAITAYLFNGRTRALVALMSGLGSIVGSILIGLVTASCLFAPQAGVYCLCLGCCRHVRDLGQRSCVPGPIQT